MIITHRSKWLNEIVQKTTESIPGRGCRLAQTEKLKKSDYTAHEPEQKLNLPDYWSTDVYGLSELFILKKTDLV